MYATFLVGNTLTNPTAVTFDVSDGEGTQTSYVYGTDAEVTRPETGVYRVELLLDPPGEWSIRATGTGAAAGSNESKVLALESPLL